MSKSLRIGLIMQGSHGWMGGIEYIKSIILGLATLPLEVRSTFELCLICSHSLEADLYDELSSHLDHIYNLESERDPATLLNRIDWKLRRIILRHSNPAFDDFVKKAGIDFVYPHLAFNKTSYRWAAWIFDFQHKYLTEFFSKEEIESRDKYFGLTSRYAKTVVLSSKSAQADFNNFFSEAAHKSKVLSFRVYPNPEWFAADPRDVQEKYYLPERFFLVCNQFWQHKNYLVIFKALKFLQDKSVYPIVVCTGSLEDNRRPEYIDFIIQQIHKLGVARQVYLLGILDRSVQIQLLRRSLAVIQPSLFEGWSTVVEEARCLGKPIILSDIPVHQEQHPPHSIYFERNSYESLAPILADWWEHLSPGPDLDKEEVARKDSLQEVKDFALRFLEIAKFKF